MGWFDEQIEYRKKRERQLLADSFENIARSITGGQIGSIFDENADVSGAITQLLKYFHIPERDIPPKLKSLEERLDYLLSSSGIMYREVILEEGWHKDAMGVLITKVVEDGSVVTVKPGALGGYEYADPNSGKKLKVTAQTEKTLGKEAYCFYRPLPERKLTLKDLVKYMLGTMNGWDILSFVLAAAAITLAGILMPKFNHILMGQVVEYKDYQLLFAVMSFMFFATIGSILLTIIRQLLLARINAKLNVNTQAASMMRVLSLPAGFFRQYTAGELNEYLNYMNGLCSTLVDTLLSTGITSVFSLVYLAQVFTYAKSLVIPSLAVTVSTVLIGMIASVMQVSINKENMRLSAEEKGLTLSLISGIQKIRLSGAENRVFAKWSEIFSQEAALTYDKPAFIKLNTVITTAISLVGTIVMYYVAVNSRVSVADYFAFNSAYAYISSAFTELAAIALTVATIRPSLEIIMPLLEAVPELQDDKETVTNITGAIEISHLSFKYSSEGPTIIDDLNLTIPARQYVAVVGRTGCGKSTLMRLLLGFEKPTKGAIFYDKKDTRHLDMRSVRRLVGTVMQDGTLFGGSIYENITISAPSLKLDDAWDAAEKAGIAEDIRAMPMGMHTVLQDGGGGISGGQRQRLMIARAVAPKPKLLLLDEATSALDNITQKHVAEALDKMRCTRIVIAHRLSTIRHCDRILVLDQGKIVEDGTYDELMELNGFFAELVERQQVTKSVKGASDKTPKGGGLSGSDVDLDEMIAALEARFKQEEKPDDESGEKLAGEMLGEPAEESGGKPAEEESAGESIEKPAEELAGKPLEKLDRESGGKPAREPAGEALAEVDGCMVFDEGLFEDAEAELEQPGSLGDADSESPGTVLNESESETFSATGEEDPDRGDSGDNIDTKMETEAECILSDPWDDLIEEELDALDFDEDWEDQLVEIAGNDDMGAFFEFGTLSWEDDSCGWDGMDFEFDDDEP